MVKIKKVKRKRNDSQNDIMSAVQVPPVARSSDEPPKKKVKWINKQRVLVFACRGISHRDRHLMEDLRTLMPHSKPENKMERRDNLFVVNEMCEMKNCNKCLLLEGRRQQDLYMWVASVPHGPSAKFLVENVYTMAELKLTGNCLKGSRPLLSFDDSFKSPEPHYALLKELFTQVFGTPNHHPKSQPFIDHVMTFTILDNRIWFRNFQILSEDGALSEIGPRLVLNPIKIFDGSFGGQTLWENPFYVSPTKYRQQLTKAAAGKYVNRVQQKIAHEESKPEHSYQTNVLDEIFLGDPLEKAKEIVQENHDAGVRRDRQMSVEVKKVAKNIKRKNKKLKIKIK
ncbi:ribosome biogenesis protein BRX1 homolog [Bacillus rossius redtenbacheri]|uniref:ribosome biogenesis protein BRX1 homolog n=1 Tax=Bacillus rossius redtenbacheri TaxID=93214 RepID=UPI002FDD68E9